MSELRDFSKIHGKMFVASTGRVARATVLGPGGISAHWFGDDRETDEEREEFERWTCKQIGIPYESFDVTRADSGLIDPGVTVAPIEFQKYKEFLRGPRVSDPDAMVDWVAENLTPPDEKGKP